MSESNMPAQVGSTDGLGPEPERAAFEHWFSDGGKHPRAVQRNLSGNGYYLAAAQSTWTAWQAGVAAERERCAKLADEYATWSGSNFSAWFEKLAAAIRA